MTEEKLKKPTKKKISSIIYNCIIVLLVILVIILIYNRINHRATFVFGRTILIIASGSMEPGIPTGSCILVEKTGPGDISAGDVITFYSDDPKIAGSMNTHRVVSVSEGAAGIEFVTKGDANYIVDEYTAKADKLVGKFVKILPVLTVLSSFFLSGFGFFILILAFVTYIAISVIRAVLKNKKKSEEDRKAEFDRKVAEEVKRLKSENGKNDKKDGLS
jgi:signal peptidase